jgi:ABC-type nickel/cobalt efflux system permease component RcnA
MEDSTWILIAVAALIVIGLAIYAVRRRDQRHVLQERFGPEYDRTVDELGRKDQADDALQGRLERHDELELRELTPDAREHYAAEWQHVQARFVDEPKAAVREADLLLASVMGERGYPVSQFAERADLVSVDHPDVVHHYREAHDVYLKADRMEASTEDLRRAVIHYRALFDELLDHHRSSS